MSDKLFVVLSNPGLDKNRKSMPISCVTLLLDDGKIISSGDDTGANLFAYCPDATKEIGSLILSQIRGEILA